MMLNNVTLLNKNKENLLIHSRVVSEARNRLWWYGIRQTLYFVLAFLFFAGLLVLLESRKSLVQLLEIPNPEVFYVMEPAVARVFLILAILIIAVLGFLLVPRSFR